MNDVMMTVVGNVVRDVELRFTTSGDPVASFRVASNTRRFDRASERWVEGDTHYLTVTCWRNLASNVVASLKKGMPVLVYGRLRSREVTRTVGETTQIVRYQDVEAYSVGPDLARGTAEFSRVKSAAVVENEERTIADALGGASELEHLEDLESVDLETGEIRDPVSA
jgi:single-strand DNA-binding protein